MICYSVTKRHKSCLPFRWMPPSHLAVTSVQSLWSGNTVMKRWNASTGAVTLLSDNSCRLRNGWWLVQNLGRPLAGLSSSSCSLPSSLFVIFISELFADETLTDRKLDQVWGMKLLNSSAGSMLSYQPLHPALVCWTPQCYQLQINHLWCTR